MKVRITRKHEVAQDICAFEMTDLAGAPLPAFSAGAHIDVYLGHGLTRQYSLCNSPNETHRYMIGVLRDPGSRGGSVAMHALGEGSVLEISEPKNHFPLVHGAGHSILLAGGIGVTPILCMAGQLSRTGASFEVHYCAREAARAAFRERFAEADMVSRARVYFDTAAIEARIDLQAVLARPDADTHLYVCGPAGFIQAVLDTAAKNGWNTANLHREYFAAVTQAGAVDGGFQVKLGRSGRVVDVAATQTVVEALSGCGVEVPVSCEQGVCGTCLTRVLEGEPDHRDVYLTDEERAANDQFLPCCSRARSAVLVLDL